MSKNWPNDIEEKLILTDASSHKITYQNSDGIKEKFHVKTKRKRLLPKRALFLAATLLIACMSAFASKTLWHITNPGTYEGDYLKVGETKHISYDSSMEVPPTKQEPAGSGLVGQESGGQSQAGQTQAGQEAAGQGLVGQKPAGQESMGQETAGQGENQHYDDRYFLAQTAKTIRILSGGKVDLNGLDMTIQYQTNEIYERAEAEVLFQLGDKPVNVRFDRESGYLIGISYWPGEDTEDKKKMSDSDVTFAAVHWYDKLPFPQGYLCNNLTKMDEHMWFLDFSRQVEFEIDGEKITLSNPYETVRLGIDPCNGALVLANVFYMPLLDDHEEDMKPLGKEDAMRIATWYYGKLRGYTDAEIRGLLEHAKNGEENLKNISIIANVCIALPRYESLMDPAEASALKETNVADSRETDSKSTEETDDTDVTDNTVTATTNDTMISYRYSKVSRLAWKISFERANNLFTDRCDIAVDLYTGEVIAVESTK